VFAGFLATGGRPYIGFESTTAMLETTGEEPLFDEAQLAVAAFLARYSGRTLDAYRFDL